MKNLEIRSAVEDAGLRFWQLADALAIAESTLSKRLRHELPEDEKERILTVIRQLKEARHEPADGS